jgi:hypothetical protein
MRGMNEDVNMNEDVKRCECTENLGPGGCPAAASWRVRVGTRRTDAQLSCGRHLHRVCLAMTGAEAPRNASLTVARLGSWDERIV